MAGYKHLTEAQRKKLEAALQGNEQQPTAQGAPEGVGTEVRLLSAFACFAISSSHLSSHLSSLFMRLPFARFAITLLSNGISVYDTYPSETLVTTDLPIANPG